MAITNAAISGLLRRYAGVLALEGADRFKVKAYRRAAETLDVWPQNMADLVAQGQDLKTLPGIGKAISSLVEEIVGNGKMSQLDKALARLPSASAELSAWPGLDPKKVLRIYKKLKIGSVQELRDRLQSGEVRRTFGSRLDFHVRQGLAERPRILLSQASRLAQRIEEFVKTCPGVTRVAAVGSLRRKLETVGDLNFLVAGSSAARIFRSFSRFGGIAAAERRDEDETVFRMSNGLGISLRWTKADNWGWMLLTSTGSPAHLDDLKAWARKKHVPLSAGALAKKRIDMSQEESIYKSLGLIFIEPELREGRGEIQAASTGRLPHLVSVADLKGDLHMHTTASDGADSLADMARAAQHRGYEYIAITDHSQSLKITNGLSEKRLREQISKIDRLNSRLTGFTVLKSAEVDILEDGSLDYPNSLLCELDVTICSIHSRFALNKQQQTERILRAMDNPCFNILGHATGRLLLKREGYELDIDRVIEHARSNGCFFEINSSPDRLDLSDENARLAKDAGVKIAVNTDAHSVRELELIGWGINQARRAWLAPADVLNSTPLAELRQALHR